MATLPTNIGSRRARLWPWVLLVGSTVPLLVVLAVGLGRDPRTIPSPLIGHPAPGFALSLFDGRTATAASFRGRVLVVNFWASWCTPACYEEAPELQRIWETLRDRGITIIGINIQDREPAAREFIRALGLTFPNGADPQGKISIDYGVYGVPETFILDPQGRLVYKHVGAITARIILAHAEPLLPTTRRP